MMNGHRKSDNPIEATKRANKTGAAVTERVEQRGLAEGKPRQQNTNEHRIGPTCKVR